MRIRSPSLSELHAFATAARLGSFSQAAEELHVTQGAISRAIGRLEEHLALALFMREGRRSILTPAGQSYLDAIAPAIASIEAATVALQTRRTRRALRLSVAPTLFSHWLIPRLPDFHAQYPETTLSFAPYRRDDPLQAPEIDAWLRVGCDRWPRHIQANYVVGRELVPICRPADLQGPHAIRTAQDLLTRPLLFHTNYPDNWACWFRGVGCGHPPLAPAADFELVALLVQAVIAGLGVAVVQRCLVEKELAAGRIAIAVPLPVVIDRGYYLCQPTGHAAPAALQDFSQWLLAQAQAQAQHASV
ncbi:LysR family transcriptional regulator [Acidovorax carolinensis]|uniref:LysR family transcriptional regulator n=1 Tax=Acidovorax carolinensis TaxID=553814 RepID=A0A240UET6_9BURK|nr:LysR substrate-binding domain-containing protein [Acidovorax carolinensis]ART54353.1 LysR family transcriptional regulator [Acidovorax carolinensis]ART60014.1 LysR family transcriptional regulator [Acidovorax carolinensis]